MPLLDSGGITAMGSGLAASLAPDDGTYHNVNFESTCYAGVRLNSDGRQYYKGPNNSWSIDTWNSSEAWLVSGDAADFWVEAQLISGTLDDQNSGTGAGTWLQLNTTRSWSIVDTTAGVSAETASVQLTIATDNSGSNVVAGPITYTLSAWNDNGL